MNTLLSLRDLHLAQHFPQRIHPRSEEVEYFVDNLCESLDIKLDHYHNYQSMPYFMFPDTTIERLVALSVLSNLLYYIDDLYDRHKTDPHPESQHLPKIFKRVIRIFCVGQEAMPQEHHLFYDVALALHQHFLDLSTETWFLNFAEVLTAHLMATRPSSDSEPETYTSVQDYFCIREQDGGIWTSIKSIEFAADIFLPHLIHEHSHIQHMSIVCGRIATLTNDLFSYEKEVIKMESQFNLIVVLMQTESLCFEQAVQRAIEAINDDIAEFLYACQTMPDFGSDALNQGADMYKQGLCDILSATWHWQMSTDRYRSTTSPFVELRLAD